MKRAKKQQKAEVVEEVQIVMEQEVHNCGKCIHCEKQVESTNVNQGFIHVSCLTHLDPKYPENFTKKPQQKKETANA